VADSSSKSLAEAARTTWRFLTFRASRIELGQLGCHHLLFGLFWTWVVGIGRYWDSDRAEFLQHFGVGSLVYVFALSALLWAVVYPFNPKNWRYTNVVTFVAMTSPPAILYAIPVERWTDLHTAGELNVYALLIVATWRVALLFFALRRLAGLLWREIFFSAALPLIAIVTALSALNLEKAVFNIMAGIQPGSGTAADQAYGVVLAMTFFAWMALPVVAIGWVVTVILARRRAAREVTQAGAPQASAISEAADDSRLTGS
jgi:hypothetical protein